MPKTKPSEYFEILNVLHDYNINPNSREVYLGGWPANYDDEEVGVDHQMAMEFIRNMTFLQQQSDDPILIHMGTIGGEVSYGLAIYDAIHECDCYVTVRAYAHARSMSSIIIQAADLRQIMPSCYFMIHEGRMTVIDTVKGVKSYMELSEQDEERMLNIYTEKCDPDKKTIQMHMDRRQEWYLSAAEAVELGFVDEVYER